MEQKFYWTARLFLDGRAVESKYFETQAQRDAFVSEHLEWKKRGKICAENLEKHLRGEPKMNWIDEAAAKLKRKNQVLFAKDSEYLQDLVMLFQGQDHRVMVLWALDLAAESIAQLEEKYPEERRPREALEAAQEWAAGNVKMRFAQRKILDCHAVAKEITSKEDIAICHAIGQACAVVHTAGHALGYPIYDLTALICKYGIENCAEAVERRKQEYINKLLYWNAHLCDYQGTWAAFMLK